MPLAAGRVAARVPVRQRMSGSLLSVIESQWMFHTSHRRSSLTNATLQYPSRWSGQGRRSGLPAREAPLCQIQRSLDCTTASPCPKWPSTSSAQSAESAFGRGSQPSLQLAFAVPAQTARAIALRASSRNMPRCPRLAGVPFAPCITALL